MNGLTTEQAVQNLDNLIATSRMNRQEHVAMQQSLEHLKFKAMELDELEESGKEAKKEVDDG